MPGFVVQQHFARTHDFVFRQERDGLFQSWAVPKGIPEYPSVKRLAIQVDDHDLIFGDFEGTIPEGEYGAGEVWALDGGQDVANSWETSDIAFSLSGQRLRSSFRLVRFKQGKDKDWLLFKPDSGQ